MGKRTSADSQSCGVVEWLSGLWLELTRGEKQSDDKRNAEQERVIRYGVRLSASAATIFKMTSPPRRSQVLCQLKRSMVRPRAGGAALPKKKASTLECWPSGQLAQSFICCKSH